MIELMNEVTDCGGKGRVDPQDYYLVLQKRPHAYLPVAPWNSFLLRMLGVQDS